MPIGPGLEPGSRKILHKLRGMGQNKWKMVPERRTESGGRIRLRQVPPVTADRVIPAGNESKFWMLASMGF